MDCIIIGGGIGGLTSAIALRGHGIDAHVFEAAPELREVGAGIWMPPNAMQVLDRLGIAGAVRSAGRAVQRAELHDAQRGLLQAMDLGRLTQRYHAGTVAIHRARLQQILAAGLPPEVVHLGRECTDITQEPGLVQVRFGDGGEVGAPLAIGADGLRSVVRSRLFPRSTIRYSGQTSYRGVARCSLPSQLVGSGWEVWSAGCRFGFSAIADEEVYWFAVEDAPSAGVDPPGTVLPHLKALFESFPGPAAMLLERTAEEAITRTDLCDLQPMRTWYSGRVALLGDAAHATTPNLGQGGAQAIEDAYILADRLAENGADVTRAFVEYQQRRKPKADRVVNTSWWLGKMAHLRNPLARRLRNTMMRLTPDRASERQMHYLFELQH